MAEKPRLKETDEIFSAIGKSSFAPRTLSGDLEAPSATAEEATNEGVVIDSVLSAQAQSNRRARSRRTRTGTWPDAAPQDIEDSAPLDIERYTTRVPGSVGTTDPEHISPQGQSNPQNPQGMPTPRQTSWQRRRVEHPDADAMPAPQIRRINPPSAAQDKRSYPSDFRAAPPSAPTPIGGLAEPPATRTHPSVSQEGLDTSFAQQGRTSQQGARATVYEDEPESPQKSDSASGKVSSDARTYDRNQQPTPHNANVQVQAPASLEGPVEQPAFRRANAPASSEGSVERPTNDAVRAQAPASLEGPVEPPKRVATRESAPASQEGPVEPPKNPSVKPFVLEDLAGPSNSREDERLDAVRSEAGGLSPEDKPSREKQALLEQLSSQFENAFEEAFEGKETGKAVIEPSRSSERARARHYYSFEVPQAGPIPVDTLPEDQEADQEAESFLQEFAQKVKVEEENRAELFKDTLAEKFERERQRYLKELGIDPDRPAAAQGFDSEHIVPPAVRRLDVQIDPEMHTQPGDAPPVRKNPEPVPQQGVTYSRYGATRPLEGEEPSEASTEKTNNWKPSPDKKTAAELLLDLGRQSSATAADRDRPPPHRAETARTEQMQELLRKANAEEPRKKEKPPEGRENPPAKKKTRSRGNRIIILTATLAAMLLLALIAIPVLTWLQPKSTPSEENPSPNTTTETELGTTLELYETRLNTEGRGEYDNVMIKRANIQLKNASIEKNIVIADISTQGEIVLEDLTVGGTIQLQNCEVNTLTLRNVQASRLVISNAGTRVSVNLVGYGGVDTVELRTPATVNAVATQGADTYAVGVNNMILKAAGEVSLLHITLNGITLHTLASSGEAVLELGEDTLVEKMTSEGALSVSGTGTILQMTASPPQPGETLVLNMGTSVNNLDVRGVANITVANQIDSLVTAENLTLNGTGRISYLTLNPPVGVGRLLVNIDGVGITSLIANAESRISAVGDTRINELTANESVYALGNKVNQLVVNADGVIYESEPDKIQVKQGVRPAESMADNPNLDYNLSSTQQTETPDTSADEFSTVCGHSRDVGGYLQGDGSVSNPYHVSTPAQLAHVSLHLNSHYTQTADIDIASDSRYVAFPMIAAEGTPFAGSYDGGGYRITNLRINSTAENVGLFAENTGTIRHVNLYSGDIRGAATGPCFVGGIVGFNYQSGSIMACSNGAAVTGSETAYVGGIAGYNYVARIRDCYNSAKITGTANIGGIVGVNRDNNSSVSGCYNIGVIEGGTVDTGAVVGVNNGGVVTNTYYLVNTAELGIGTGGGTATARSADEMSGAQMVADLAAGNESTLWMSGSGAYNYPVLKTPVSSASSRNEAEGTTVAQAPQTPPQSEVSLANSTAQSTSESGASGGGDPIVLDG